MGTIADKLNLLLSTKAAIKTAIIEKGQSVADADPFASYPAKIQAIQTGVQLPALTNPGAAADLLAGKQLIDADGNPLTGTMPEVAQATPLISVSSAGLITVSADQAAGYVAAGTKSATKQLATKAAATITPGTADQTIAAGTYLIGAQTIKGDANLLAANIKSGVSIFGVAGSLAEGAKFYTASISITNGTAKTIYPGFEPKYVMGISEDGGDTDENTPYIVLAFFADRSSTTKFTVHIGTFNYSTVGYAHTWFTTQSGTLTWGTSSMSIKSNDLYGNYTIYVFG